MPARPGLAGVLCLLWGLAGGTQELLAGFSLLGELEEEDEEEEEKLTPVRPGGLVAVFCPVRLFRQTGQLSCFVGTEWGEGSSSDAGGRQGWGRPRGLGPPSAHLLQPGHDAAIMEEVVAGQLPHMLTQLIVVLAHGALQPRACGKWGTPVTPPTEGVPLGSLLIQGHLGPRGGRERGCVLSPVSQGEQRGP